MASPRPWFWELLAGGHGPDWHFNAAFDDAARLAAAVSRHLPAGFVRDVDFGGEPSGRPILRRYVDRHTHARLVEMRATGTRAPIWYSGEIEVDGANLAIRHFGAADLYDEAGLLEGLVTMPDLDLGAWRIDYGGDFVGEVARGRGAAALRTYLGLDRASFPSRAALGLLVAAFLAAVFAPSGPALAQMDFGPDDIPSLTGAREAEMLATYAFAKERPRMYAPVPLLHLPLTPYTEMDDEQPWSEVRVDAALQYARWTFGRCGIVLDRGPLGHLPREEMDTPQEKHLRGAGHGETPVYFVDDLPGRFLGGVESSKTKYPFAAITIANGVPVLTVLPHALGRRLNATVSERPYSMMLNDRTLIAVFGASLTGAAGFFDPRRFGFDDTECNVMREALLRETRCAPRAHVYGSRGHDRWTYATLAERRAARRTAQPWPLGKTPPDDLVVSPTFAQDGLIVFALQDGRWQGFFWRYPSPAVAGRETPGAVEIYQGFAQPGGLGLAVHPTAQEVELLTFAEGATVQVHGTPWSRWFHTTKRRPRPVRVDQVPCRIMLTSGPVGEGGPSRPLAVVCRDRIWRLWKDRAAESFPLLHPARWASMTRRCNDDALLWLGTDAGPELWRIPAYDPIEPEPLPDWARWPAVGEVPFTATWGGTPRSLDRVNIRRFDASQSPRWLPAVSEPRPAETGLWVRYEDAQGPGWVGWVDGELRVE